MPLPSDLPALLGQDPSRRPRVPGVENSDGPALRGEVWFLGGRPPAPWPPHLSRCSLFSRGVGPRDPDTAERGRSPGFWADSCPSPPAEAPDGQGQGPQAAREHRKVGKEWRGPAEVRGGASWATGGPWRQGGGPDSFPGIRLNPTSARRGRRRSRPTAAQSPGTGWAGKGLGSSVGPQGAPLTPCLPPPQHFRGRPFTSQSAAA